MKLIDIGPTVCTQDIVLEWMIVGLALLALVEVAAVMQGAVRLVLASLALMTGAVWLYYSGAVTGRVWSWVLDRV